MRNKIVFALPIFLQLFLLILQLFFHGDRYYQLGIIRNYISVFSSLYLIVANSLLKIRMNVVKLYLIIAFISFLVITIGHLSWSGFTYRFFKPGQLTGAVLLMICLINIATISICFIISCITRHNRKIKALKE